jgi:hypothetical protein
MRQIEPIAAYVAYQTCPENHEKELNALILREKF